MTARASDRIVTRQDVLAALVRMGTLPTRSSDDATAELGIYVEALGGVKADHLAGAVRAIIRGSLGHGFLPSPPELRIECDKIAKAEAAAAAREPRGAPPVGGGRGIQAHRRALAGIACSRPGDG